MDNILKQDIEGDEMLNFNYQFGADPEDNPLAEEILERSARGEFVTLRQSPNLED